MAADPYTMSIATILTASRTHSHVGGSSKKRVLETVAALICEDIPSLDSGSLFKHLVAREKLGSTGIGEGIAIPHCRVESCPGVTGTLVRLTQSVDFDAIDDQPVDLLFVLLVPEEANDEHLQILGQLARIFNAPEVRQAMRKAADDDELYRAAIDAELAQHDATPSQAQQGRAL